MIKSIVKKILRFIRGNVDYIEANYKFNKYLKYCKNNKQEQYILFATPIHGNIGDQAIIYSEEKFFEDLNLKFFEIPTYKKDGYFKVIKNKIASSAIIMIHGGGFMGTQWFSEELFVREVITYFSDNKKIIFPQTIFYKNNEFGNQELKKSIEIYNKSNIFICAREEISYKKMKEIYPNANIVLVPDIVLYLEKQDFNEERKNILLCLRNDPEKNLKDDDAKKIDSIVKKFNLPVNYTDTVINKRITACKRKKYVINKLKQFSTARVVITDRLHGMVFAALTGTPCVVMSNYNHKVKGVYKWIEKLNYIKYIEEVDDIEKNIMELLNLDKQDEYKSNRNGFKELVNEIIEK